MDLNQHTRFFFILGTFDFSSVITYSIIFLNAMLMIKYRYIKKLYN